MFDVAGDDPVTASLAARYAALDQELLGLDLSARSDDGLLELVRSRQVHRNRAAAIDNQLIAELDTRGLAGHLGQSSTAMVLSQLWRISPPQAWRRVRAAQNLGPRRGLSGAPLEPLFADAAAAQAEGAISAEHAAVIVTAYDTLPAAVQADCGDDVLASLVAQARVLDPAQLVQVGRRLHALVNPDGVLSEQADHEHNRALALNCNRDGSWDHRGHLAPECGEALNSVLQALAKPVPGPDGGKDPRSLGQRMHDALQECALRLLRSDLPATGGTPVTILVTMSADQLATGAGYGTTGSGNLLPVTTALDLLKSQGGQYLPVTLDGHGGIMDYGRTQRLATPAMRLALAARDRGCTFPGCDRPASWCEAHHVLDWLLFGPTAINNLALVCRYHHRTFESAGWEVKMIDKRPWWIPPAWLDPYQVPQLNTRHHIDLRDPD
jgi:hypothetical protein